MHRILRLFEGEIRGLHQAAYLLGFFTLLSALLALFRDRLLAGEFGAGALLDVYYTAFRIPDIIFVFLASMVSVFILVPLLTQQKDAAQRHLLLGSVVTGFSLCMLVATALAWLFTPQLLAHFFPAILATSDGLVVTVTRIVLLQPFILGLSGILASVTQVHGRYLLYAIGPILYNLGIIFGILALYPSFGMAGIAWGVVIGACLHLGIQVPFTVALGYFRPEHFRVEVRAFIAIVAVSLPRTLSVSAHQIALFALLALAATIGAGAVSVFSLAFHLQAAPLGVIGASYSVAAFPTLARVFANGDVRHFCEQVILASRHIIFWSVPLMALIVVLRAQIVRVVLGSGAFDWSDTRLTAAALALFIIALTAQALSLLFVRGYYAAGETLKPLVVNLTGALGIVLGAYALLALFEESLLWRLFIEELLRVEGLTGTALLMLPLSYALFSVLTVVVYAWLFSRDFGALAARLHRPLFESFSAAIVAGFAAYQALRVLDDIFDINTFLGVFSQGFFAGIAGIAAGVFVLWLLESRELKEVWHTLHTRFWKATPLFPSGTERGTDV